MEFNDYSESTIRQQNQKMIAQDEGCQKTLSEMRVVEEFLDDLGFLSYGRDYILCGRHTFSLQILSTSAELTAGSIISCCESGCIADAYSLLRKYRDDLFFYLYVMVYSTCDTLNCKSPAAVQMEHNIEQWLSNGLNDLYIGTVLQAIGQSPQVKDAVQKYKLRSYFKTLGAKLNNYVHGNGIAFYNQNIYALQEKTMQAQLGELLKDIRFITITFLFLLALCSPLSIMSTDYVDHLDCNMTPPDRSEYWVAPFVTEFFKRNADLIDESCMKYIHDSTLMEFD